MNKIEYSIYEDYDGNDIKTKKFNTPINKSDIIVPIGYNIADFDVDDSGTLYVRFQQTI